MTIYVKEIGEKKEERAFYPIIVQIYAYAFIDSEILDVFQTYSLLLVKTHALKKA